ncbi:hypothetical protein EHM69_02660 [candidate division KSB1 bacterium]|nr:MAG: hypothetical protein EHM69_02660 [candidate division KSB1 bacterium]
MLVEAGNFAPASRSFMDSTKARMMTDFYRQMKYDAVGLSMRELQFGVDVWKEAAKDGVPIIAANLFNDKKCKKAVFNQYTIKEDHGDRLGVIAFVSENAWKARKDTSKLFHKSPFEMGKLIKKVAKKCDHLTLIGEFTTVDAESLVRAFPEINAIVSSGIRADQVNRIKDSNAILIGSSTRGNYATFVDWNYSAADTAVHYVNKQQVLDPTVPEDTTVVRMLAKMNQTIKTGPGR